MKKGKKKLSSKYYSVTYKNNIKAGTAAVIIKGKSKYKGDNGYISFKINPKSLGKTRVYLSNTRYLFSGDERKPTVTVKDGTVILKNGTDYTVKYSNNVNPGTAEVSVTGKGNYTGTVKQTFVIEGKLNIELQQSTYNYSGKEIRPDVVVKCEQKVLSKDEYTVSYSNNVNPGTANVFVEGKGKYAGLTASATFEIKDVPPTPGSDRNKITVIHNQVSYSTPEKKTGTFTSNALPDNILSGFDETDGRTGLNHPNGIATDGEHFVVCDTWNNRVLVYNCLPTGGEAPDIVLGQPDFNSFDAGNGEAQMNWPVGATFARGKLFITDTNNYRVLVYNGIPETNGAAPDRIISKISENLSTAWPWAIWSDGEKLVLTCTLGGRVAIWNNAETAANGR